MSRWTQTQDEIKQLVRINSKISEQLLKGMFFRLILYGGKKIEGVLRNLSVGNNAGAGGSWRYYGIITIETENQDILFIDFLDIDSVVNITNDAIIKKFSGLGIITLVDKP